MSKPFSAQVEPPAGRARRKPTNGRRGRYDDGDGPPAPCLIRRCRAMFSAGGAPARWQSPPKLFFGLVSV